jgi:hypothetical protein
MTLTGYFRKCTVMIGVECDSGSCLMAGFVVTGFKPHVALQVIPYYREVL